MAESLTLCPRFTYIFLPPNRPSQLKPESLEGKRRVWEMGEGSNLHLWVSNQLDGKRGLKYFFFFRQAIIKVEKRLKTKKAHSRCFFSSYLQNIYKSSYFFFVCFVEWWKQ